MVVTLLSAVRRMALRSPTALALEAPRQQVAWCYGELDRRVRQLAGGLRELGVQRATVVVSDLPNVSENLLLQLAVSHLGASFATAKDKQMLAAKVGEVHCAVVESSGSWLFEFAQAKALPSVLLNADGCCDKLGFYTFNEVASHTEDVEDEAAFPDGLLASYNGSAMSHAQAVGLGEAAAAALESTAADKTCVSITLCHAFGMGSGIGSALIRGGAVVLPAADGIRGCGDPKQRAAVTVDVLRETRSTLLFADTHIIKQMPVGRSGTKGISALRGGLVKVSSGTDIFNTGLTYGGVPLHSIGKSL
mmetsp:Transcript_25750/g.42528  ORF Transcript_25750/g.42528 Transcript_25750/m.42528 type:complete len:306 (+) Transcript_25750:137-1054(+)|eukprot:CAMPEP_0119298332 /NCGR_PEP_ID=MMETSP1333-20130426/531_1 /TAXON_ID=418940 /ORGANISM="Scyphosphaera apsteinii, Strain RCC1455" /LENGTH=305 /DNA_ID=CAMNT_0007299411 /DNA_START=137 /DNA_END=1054 /DNA_ORIENTATION=+